MAKQHNYRRRYCTRLCPRRRNPEAYCATCYSYEKSDEASDWFVLGPIWRPLIEQINTHLTPTLSNISQSLFKIPPYVLILPIFIVLIWIIPRWQLPNIGIEKLKEDKVRFELEDQFRRTTAQILGGIGLAVGLYLTWRRIAAMERSVQINEEGQITERFTKAIEQVGSEKLEIRLGGIYALERIARDSERDHSVIMEVLTAYVRENSAERNLRPQPEKQPDAESLQSEECVSEPQSTHPQSKPNTDIQAILTVLGRRSNTTTRF